MRQRFIPYLALIALLAATACGAGLERPEVRMDGVRLGGLGFQGGLVYVSLSVFNPNGTDLSAERLTYDFDVADPGGNEDDWVDFATGEYREPMRVAGNDSTVVEIPIEFSYSEVGGVIRSVIDRGTLRYRVRGSVDVSRPLRAEVPFSKSGTVALMSGR